MNQELNIKGLRDAEYLRKQIVINSGDGYSNACVQVAINVMKYLDEHPTEYEIGYYPNMNTTHGIICHCDDQGGITGFMASAARNIVAVAYKDGWKFYLADTLSKYDIEHSDRINDRIDNILKSDAYNNLEEKEVREYVNDLIKRYKENNPE
jgi:hypothetical protein